VIAAVVAALRDLLDAGIPVVAYNAPFDFSLLKYEALRHGIPPILEPSPVIDPLVLDKAHDRFRRGKRTLEAVAAHYAVPLVGAHDAAADAIAAGRVAQALARRFDSTPRSTSCTPVRSAGRARRPTASRSTSSASAGSTRTIASTAAGPSADLDRRRGPFERHTTKAPPKRGFRGFGYLLEPPKFLKRWLNFSTRPAESMMRCLPV
jgi:DNA polymerase III epsilon subunit-like protein